MSAAPHRRHLSRDEREDRARLRSVSPQRKRQQLEDSRWGVVLGMFISSVFMVGFGFILWQRIQQFLAGRPDFRTLLGDALMCLCVLILIGESSRRLFVSFRNGRRKAANTLKPGERQT
jgi:hypothetical protein